MAVEVTLDTLDLSSLDRSATQPSTLVRGGVVTGVVLAPDATGTDPESLFKIQTAIGIPFGTALSANFNTYTLQRIFVQGIVPGGAKFQLIYQNLLFSGIPPSTYILRDGATLQSVGNVNLLPRLKTLLRVATITLADGTKVPSRKASFTYTQNLRVVGVSALLFGQPQDLQDIVGKVNSGFWHGKNQGYWKAIQWETAVSRYAGYYTLNAAAATKGNEDWADTEVLFNPAIGDVVSPAAGDVAAASSAPYSFGIILNSPGILKVGLYELANFSAAFGVT
jgi:hypothetical protein